MNCTAFREQAEDHLDGQLDVAQARAWREHRAACADCRRIADALEADHLAITEATKRYMEGLSIPSGGRAAVLRGIEVRLRWRWTVPTVAALLVVGILIACFAHTAPASSPGGSRRGDPMGQPDGSAHLLAELTALKAWQDDLAHAVATTTDDHLWRMVACTYLPPALVPSALSSPSAVAGESPAPEHRTVLSWQRTTHRSDRTTTVDFQQCDDGSVHVEQRTTSADEETVTRLDAASWDLLVAGNGSLCREFGLLGTTGDGQAGWPLPALGRLVRDARLALQGSAPPVGLAQRLMALRLAPHVTAPDDLETAMLRILDRPLPLPATNAASMSGPQLLEEIHRLAEATGAARLTPGEWHAAMRCLPAIRRGWAAADTG